MTDDTPINAWFREMRRIWLEKKPDEIATILSNAFEYHESPFGQALTSKHDVVAAWQAILDQDIETVEIEILYQTSNVGFAIWTFKQKDQPKHIGSYYLQLNEQGKCKVFRQWWNKDTQ